MNRTPSKNGERNVYSWVPPVTRFFYFTGFPLLLFLLIVSLFKDSLLDFLEKKYSSTNTSKQRK